MADLGSQHRIGKYIVDTVLGQGGMGVVYNAHDNYRRVAIKMMLTTLSSNPKLMGRFQREAQLTARLQHPNIVTVYDWGEQDGAPYLVMQYLEGSSLDACRFDVPPTMALLKKLRIVSQVCAGLQYAHSQKMDLDGQIVNGVVHRDIKPANIFVLTDESVKLLDFGIAHLGMDGDGAERPMTRTGQLIGSLNYMSPEQANGARLDTRTDIFSLGVVLYELVAGVRPFEGHDTISTLTRILTAPPPPIEQYLPDCPPELIEVILRALEKSPRDRYQTAEELAFDLSLIETQLRRQLAKEHLELAEAAMERSDWVKALEILAVLLKLDGEHVRGLSMHREVQRIVRRQHRADLAERLKVQATEALEKRLFKDALRLAEEAVGLDDSNYDLVVLRDDIRKNLQRSERSRLAAERAENNLRSDRLTDAERSLNEAFQLDPGNTQAQQLQLRLADALAEQNKRAQFQAFLKKTVESLDQRRYQSALDFLTEARVLNPNATELDTLTRKAVQGQEQERREQEVKALGEEIRALAVGSIDQAEEKLTAAMQSYPDEPSLLELEDTLSQLRREEAVRLALARAESGLREQRLEDAQAAVHEALSLDPGNPEAEQVASRISAAMAERARRAQLQLLVQQARESLSQQRYGDALNHLRAAEGVDANDPEVAALIEEAVQGQEQERREQEVKALGDEIWALLAVGSIDQAEEKLFAAMRSYPGEPSLQELELTLAQWRREEAVRLALERAESGLREHRLEDAQAAVDEALSLDPDNPRAEQLASRISAGIAERARRAQLQLLVQQARESLSQQRYGDALNYLRAAEGLVANDPEVAELIEEAVQGQEQERREQEVKALGVEIRALLAAGSIDQAEEKLSAGVQSYPGEPSLLELELTLSQLRREEAVRLALERAESGLREQRLEDAQAAVDEARSLDPANPNTEQVASRISAAIAERARRAQLKLLVQQARESLSQQRYGDALSHLKAAKGLDANDPEVAALIEQAVQGQEQERREQEVKALGVEIRALLAAGSIDQAEEKLSAATRSYPGEPSLLELEDTLSQLRRAEAVGLALERAESSLREQRLEDAQAAVDEVLSLDPANPNAEQVASRISAAMAERARRAQLQLLIQQARESLSQPRYGDALNHLRAAEGVDANDAEVAALIEQAVQGQEQERREQEVKALGAEIRALLAAGSIDQAEKKLSAARRGYPGEPSLLELELTLSQLRREEAVRLALERAESGLEEQRLEDAQAAVDEVLSLDPANPHAQQVASRISAAMAERARRAQLQLLVHQARESLSQQRYGDALTHLRAAESLDANDLEVAALIEQAVQGQGQERREQELKALGEEIRALLAAGSVNQAKEKLSAAMRSYPGEASLLELELTLSQLHRAEAVRLALERGGTSLQEKRLEDAQAAVDEALSLDPANPSARHLQPRIERARFKRAQASSLMDEASKEIEMRRYSSALDLLKQAKGLDTGIAGIDELVQRALEGQAKEKRQRTIDSLDEEIRELIATENFKIAGARLTAALGQFAEEQQFLDLDQILKQKQSVAELRQAKEKQDREIFTIFKNIRKLIGDGKLSLAQTRLTTALQRFPDEPALLELSRELFPTRDQEQQQTIMLTVTEAPPAPLEELPQVSADDTAFIESLTQGMETGLLTSSGTAIGGHDEPEVKLKPEVAGPQVAPAIDWTLWQDAVPAPAPVEVQPEPPTPFTLYVDDFVPVHDSNEVTTEVSAPVEVEPPPPLEPTAPVTAEAAAELSPETLSVYDSVAPVVLAKAEAAPPQPTSVAPVHSPAVAAPEPAVAWVEPKVAVPAPRVPSSVDVPAPTPPARPWLVWGAVAAVVLGGIIYGVVRLSSPATKPHAIITVPFSIGSDPAGAKVQVEGNGQSKDCVTPLCALSLPPGSYQVKATLAGYEESNRTLEVQAGLTPVQIQLTPISLVVPGAVASSLVVQTPGVQDASVFVDGKEFKVSGSELSISGNLHNTYQIQVKKDGYQPSASEPFTLAHSTEKLVVRLKELPNAATLILDKSTPNADVLIDDKSAGRMSSAGRFQTTVPPGPHKIQLSLDGRASDPGSRQFDPRARVTLSINVPPPPIVQKPPAETAKVETTQTPPPPVVPRPTPPPDVAKTMWESIKDTTDPDMLIKFGNQYPEYADRARERMTVLDQKTWDAAKDSGDERRLKSYLTVFPGGKYVSNAREAIDGFHRNTDEAGVRQALDRFNQAVNAMNMDQLHGAWLGMSPTQAKRYKQLFANSSKIDSRISVNPNSIKVTGDTAEVACQQTIVVTMGGQRSSTNGPLRITLRRNDNGWVIDQVD